MNEMVLFGTLVAICVFSLGFSFDLVRSGDEGSEPAWKFFFSGADATDSDSGDLDIDLSGCEVVTDGRGSAAHLKSRRAARQPSALTELYLRNLEFELRSKDVGELDFDLSGLAEEGQVH